VINRYLDLLFGREKPADISACPQAPGKPEPDAAQDGKAWLSFDNEAFATRAGFNPHEYRWGDGAANLLDFRLTCDGLEFSASIDSGADVMLYLAIRFNRTIINPILGFTLKTKEGITVYGTNSLLLESQVTQALGTAGSTARASLRFVNRLASGDYFISVGIASRHGNDIVPHDRRYDAIHFVVPTTPQLLGLIDLAVTMEIDQVLNDAHA
jgi:lipopolysaccharide transport system ATP-binding protein